MTDKQKERNRKWRENNREKWLESNRKYHAKNKERDKIKYQEKRLAMGKLPRMKNPIPFYIRHAKRLNEQKMKRYYEENGKEKDKRLTRIISYGYAVKKIKRQYPLILNITDEMITLKRIQVLLHRYEKSNFNEEIGAQLLHQLNIHFKQTKGSNDVNSNTTAA